MGRLCNKQDTAVWFRLVKWKNGYVNMGGGLSTFKGYGYCASFVMHNNYHPEHFPFTSCTLQVATL